MNTNIRERILTIVIVAAFLTDGGVRIAHGQTSEPALMDELSRARGKTAKIEVYLKLARYYEDHEENDKAMDAYRSIVKYHPLRKTYYSTLVSLGDVFLKTKQYAQAIESYQQAIELVPRREEARLRAAAAYEATDLNELARQEYVTVLKRNPKSFQANFSLGNLYLKQGLTSKALEQYRSALTIKPDKEVYLQISRCAETIGDIPLAIAMLRQASSMEQTYDGQIRLGRLYELQKRKKDAEEAYSSAIRINPERVEAYLDLGLLYVEDAQFVPAEKLLQIAQEKSPDEGIPHFFLGFLYYHQQKMDAALSEMKEAQELAKGDMLRDYAHRFAVVIAGHMK